jgi:hypothetical protein
MSTFKNMKRLIFITAITAFIFSCHKSNTLPEFDNMDITTGFVLDNPLILREGSCAGDLQTHTYICLDSVVNDSRCPEGVECFWEGNAAARFKFVSPDKAQILFNLNTNSNFTRDTTIGGYKFTLNGIYPYPVINIIIPHKNYRAEITIEKVNI